MKKTMFKHPFLLLTLLVFIFFLFFTSCNTTGPGSIVVIDGAYLGQTISMNPGNYGSRATVTFTSETQIDITGLTIRSVPDALFYLGYGGSAGDYVDRGKRISEVFQNKNNDSLTLSINPPLNQLDYTHIAIICRQYRAMINPGIQYK